MELRLQGKEGLLVDVDALTEIKFAINSVQMVLEHCALENANYGR